MNTTIGKSVLGLPSKAAVSNSRQLLCTRRHLLQKHSLYMCMSVCLYTHASRLHLSLLNSKKETTIQRDDSDDDDNSYSYSYHDESQQDCRQRSLNLMTISSSTNSSNSTKINHDDSNCDSRMSVSFVQQQQQQQQQ
ncbi:hypothetical protein GQ42DRAFT_93119 [Ramicandelaber brevisporus]|nr:hypothetical protein GQ42DRAFT_93119 [Ramicandelaber brevisporus]